MHNPRNPPQSYTNPYLAGLLLGATLFCSFIILGAGLGASGAWARFAAWLERLVAPAHVASSEYFGVWGPDLLGYYLIFMVVGVFVGGLFSALTAGRVRLILERGLQSSFILRAVLALLGGVIMGFAARLARGCPSGQGLTGAALLSAGSFLFLICAFVGGYAAALLVRRQWHD